MSFPWCDMRPEAHEQIVWPYGPIQQRRDPSCTLSVYGDDATEEDSEDSRLSLSAEATSQISLQRTHRAVNVSKLVSNGCPRVPSLSLFISRSSTRHLSPSTNHQSSARSVSHLLNNLALPLRAAVGRQRQRPASKGRTRRG